MTVTGAKQIQRETKCSAPLLQQVISNKVQWVPFPDLLSKSRRDFTKTGLPETYKKGSSLLLKGETCFSLTIAMGANVRTKQNRNRTENIALFEAFTVTGDTVKSQEDSDFAFLGWNVAFVWQAATIVPLSQRRRQRADLWRMVPLLSSPREARGPSLHCPLLGHGQRASSRPNTLYYLWIVSHWQEGWDWGGRIDDNRWRLQWPSGWKYSIWGKSYCWNNVDEK